MERRINYSGIVSVTNSGYREITIFQGEKEIDLVDVIMDALGDIPAGYKNKYCGEIRLGINLIPNEILVDDGSGMKPLEVAE